MNINTITKISYSSTKEAVRINNGNSDYPLSHPLVEAWINQGNTISNDIEILQQEKHQQRKSLRDMEKYAYTIESQGYTFNTDKETLGALSLCSKRLNANTTLDWFDIDDTPITLTQTQVIQLIDDVYIRGLNATIKSKAIKAQINSITDVDILDDYDVQAEWSLL